MRGLRSFRDRTVVITGASSGIGEQLALRCARDGARIALVARRRPELERVASLVQDAGGQALVLPCDVAQRHQVFTAAEQILQHWGAVDVLVNNAGFGGHRPFLDWPIEDIERIMQVNYMGAVYWTKALLPHMVQRGQGWIVMMASVAGKLGVPDESAYAATKFAMVGLAEALSYEVEDRGVHVLTVCPGAIDTPFFTDDILSRLPAAARLLMVPPGRVAAATCDALRKPRWEITVPAFYRTLDLLRAVARPFLRLLVRKLACVGAGNRCASPRSTL